MLTFVLLAGIARIDGLAWSSAAAIAGLPTVFGGWYFGVILAQRLDRRPDGIEHFGIEARMMSGTSTWSSDDGLHPGSRPGHHDDRWMVFSSAPIRAAS